MLYQLTKKELSSFYQLHKLQYMHILYSKINTMPVCHSLTNKYQRNRTYMEALIKAIIFIQRLLLHTHLFKFDY